MGYEPFTGANAKYYSDLLKEATKRRQIAMLTTHVGDLLKTKTESNEIIGEVETELYRIQERKDNEVKPVSDFLFPAITEIEIAYKNGGKVTGVLSGYPDLDDITSGFQGGDVIVLAARTSIGKTALALNMAENIALSGSEVVFFSCEMSGSQIVKRMMSSIGHINHKSLINGNLGTRDVFDDMQNANTKIMDSKLFIDDTPNIAFQELRAKSRIMRRKGAKIVFVDYLTLIKYGDAKTPRFERVGELVKEFKSLARDLDLPVVILSQLNRQAEGAKPSLAELRQSGEIEEHSDVILLLHRARGEQATDLIIAKHRNGMTDSVPLYFDEQYVRFRTGERGIY
jgi:replicative DNA helicase